MFQGHDDQFNLTAITKDGKPACQLKVVKELDYELTPLYRMTITVMVRQDHLMCAVKAHQVLLTPFLINFAHPDQSLT